MSKYKNNRKNPRLNDSLYHYKNQNLYWGDINLLKTTQKNPTPFYLYNLKALVNRFNFFKKQCTPAQTFYSAKANSHFKILQTFKKEGAGVDVVSGGEIKQALKAGFRGQDIVFSGVGKTEEEIKLSLNTDILQFNVESVSELKKIAHIARKIRKKARVAFRINPDVNPVTHPYIKTGLREHKFGLEEEQVPFLIEIVKKSGFLDLYGLTLHIGSQIQDITPLKEGILKVGSLYKDLQKEFYLKTFDVGGGLGLDYKSQKGELQDLKLIEKYGNFLKKLSKNLSARILTEPGRVLTARFGCLIGKIQYIKSNSYKNFVILNTGMHHLMRPCLYQAYHRMLLLQNRSGEKKLYDVAGPICESSDVLGQDRIFTGLKEGDFMAILDTGAYGAVMANSYNSHALPKELVL